MGRAVKNFFFTSITWIAIIVAATYVLRVRPLYALGTLVLGFITITRDTIFGVKNA